MHALYHLHHFMYCNLQRCSGWVSRGTRYMYLVRYALGLGLLAIPDATNRTAMLCVSRVVLYISVPRSRRSVRGLSGFSILVLLLVHVLVLVYTPGEATRPPHRTRHHDSRHSTAEQHGTATGVWTKYHARNRTELRTEIIPARALPSTSATHRH